MATKSFSCCVADDADCHTGAECGQTAALASGEVSGEVSGDTQRLQLRLFEEQNGSCTAHAQEGQYFSFGFN